MNSGLVGEVGYLVALGAGLCVVAAMLFAFVAALRRNRATASAARRVVRFSGGITLIGMGLNIADADPPISLAWGGCAALIGAYFIQAALRPPAR